MELDNKGWWQRLKDRMGSGKADSSGLPTVGDDGLMVEPASPENDSADKGTGLSRWAKRESALSQLQEGYERVNQLMADMQKHMAAQSERTERICGAIEQLARTMEDAPELSRQQSRTLETIVGQLEAANSGSQQLAETIGEMPKAARAQSEALAGISRSIEMMNEQTVVGNRTMDKLQSTIASVGQTGQIQTELLKQLDARAGEQNQRLNEMLASQTRRFTVLLVIAIVLAVAAIVTSLLAIRMH